MSRAVTKQGNAQQLGRIERSDEQDRQLQLAGIGSRRAPIVAMHQPPGNAACEHDEHERIVDCIAEGAVKLMDQHLRELEEHLMLVSPGDEKSLVKLLGLG